MRILRSRLNPFTATSNGAGQKSSETATQAVATACKTYPRLQLLPLPLTLMVPTLSTMKTTTSSSTTSKKNMLNKFLSLRDSQITVPVLTLLLCWALQRQDTLAHLIAIMMNQAKCITAARMPTAPISTSILFCNSLISQMEPKITMIQKNEKDGVIMLSKCSVATMGLYLRLRA